MQRGKIFVSQTVVLCALSSYVILLT